MKVEIHYLKKEVVDKYNIPYCGLICEVKEGEVKFRNTNELWRHIKEQYNISDEDAKDMFKTGIFDEVEDCLFEDENLNEYSPL